MNKPLALLVAASLAVPALRAGEWPMWGGTPSRNMVAVAQGIPDDIHSGKFIPKTETIDPKTTKNVKWVVKLGSQTYGTPVVSGGRVFVGTNNESPRDPAQQGDRGWVVSNRGEVICFDVKGMADGNGGPFTDEAKFSSVDGKPVAVGPKTADILWVADIRNELGIFPHNVSSCSPVIVGDKVIIATSNGVDWSHLNIPAPLAPALVIVDKNTGKVLAEEVSGVSKRALHASWGSAAFADVKGVPTIVWGGGDGLCYGFDLNPYQHPEGFPALKEFFRYDANPPEYRTKNGQPLKYATHDGPSEIIATVIVHEGRAYMAIGQDPEHGDGVGMVSCLDLTARGDITGKAVWTNKSIGRSISTPSLHEGLLYQAEYNGNIHCIDITNGKILWTYATNSRIWSSTLVADGKVYCGTEDGELIILRTGREMKLVGKPEFFSPIYASPVVANNLLHVATMTHLFAIGK
ncbi:MAG: PQQ-binding-like beta-propeller repeat protein [Opitutaceae bacterium]